MLKEKFWNLIYPKKVIICAYERINIFFSETNLLQDEDVYYLENSEIGISVIFSHLKIVQSIHIYGKERENEKEFQGSLIYNLKFSFSKEEVFKLLGHANKTGGGENNFFMGYINVWDKYYFKNYSLRIEYTEDLKNITLITIASLFLEDVFNINLQ